MRQLHTLLVLAWFTGWASACTTPPQVGELPFVPAKLSAGPLSPLPASSSVDPAQAALGERLFHDTLLDLDRTRSCASCHDIAKGGDDGLPTVDGLNTPTVLNVAFNYEWGWLGVHDSLDAQVESELPAHLGQSWASLVRRLSRNKDYQSRFRAVFHGGITEENTRLALIRYLESLTTTDTPVDRYLRGDHAALTPVQLAGHRLFESVGCTSCHNGRNIGGNMFATCGNAAPLPRPAQSPHAGRYTVTGAEADRGVFRVPSLRNVGQTAPYLHDGSIDSLDAVIVRMSVHELGRTLDDTEVHQIRSFLEALSGTVGGRP